VSESPTPDDERDAGTPGHLVAVVISHAEAPIVDWGALLLDEEGVRHTLVRAHAHPAVQGLAILATCSRTDVYAEVRDPDEGVRAILTALQERRRVPAPVLAQLQALHGVHAARRLLRIAAGLESIALGEHEIMGQVRQALQLSAALGVGGPLVHRLLERALAAGARVRHETPIGRGATTLGFAAASVVTESGAPAPDALAVVVGAGRMARQAARHLRGRGFERLAIVNRSADGAQALARALHATAHPLSELPALLAAASVVVTAIGGTAPVIDADTLAAARTANAAPLQLVDLGSPPNIDPSCATLAGTRRIDLDALHERLATTRAQRAGHIADAERIVEEEVRQFEGWRNYRHLVPAARRMREAYLAEARLAVEREVRRGDDADRERLQRFADALVRRLLHRPLTHLQSMARDAEPLGDPALQLPALERCLLDAYLAVPSPPTTPERDPSPRLQRC